ncbi:MAG: energy-coupling factor transporter transmembrane protein EcfT [Firmicutes bacterium]|nr:energy-coupling factor transporter transmembrane protein EcfT [Bacillota bacterium]
MALKDITLGQYYPVDSKIHELDARTKILAVFAYLVSLFLIKSFTGFGVAALFLFICVKMSKVPFSFVTRGFKPILMILILTIIINVLSGTGEPILTWWIIKITKEGIYRAGFMAIRLILLVFGSSVLTLTTKPISLTDGLEKIFSPLSVIGIPAHELAMMMSIALRFIPTLMEETDKIMKAQSSRGADFENGTLKEKAKALLPLLVPLFVAAFRIAGDLAMAMEARCYNGGKGRTRMNEMHYRKGDAVAAVVIVIYLALIILSRNFTLF